MGGAQRALTLMKDDHVAGEQPATPPYKEANKRVGFALQTAGCIYHMVRTRIGKKRLFHEILFGNRDAWHTDSRDFSHRHLEQ